MARSLNKAMIIGNLGNDPEIRMAGQTKVATLSVATSRKYTDRSGQQKESTQWHRVEAWGKLADVAEQYLKKGASVYVEGSIEYEQYAKDGQTRSVTKIRAFPTGLLMLGGKGANGGSNGGGQRQPAPAQSRAGASGSSP